MKEKKRENGTRAAGKGNPHSFHVEKPLSRVGITYGMEGPDFNGQVSPLYVIIVIFIFFSFDGVVMRFWSFT